MFGAKQEGRERDTRKNIGRDQGVSIRFYARCMRSAMEAHLASDALISLAMEADAFAAEAEMDERAAWAERDAEAKAEVREEEMDEATEAAEDKEALTADEMLATFDEAAEFAKEITLLALASALLTAEEAEDRTDDARSVEALVAADEDAVAAALGVTVAPAGTVTVLRALLKMAVVEPDPAAAQKAVPPEIAFWTSSPVYGYV